MSRNFLVSNFFVALLYFTGTSDASIECDEILKSRVAKIQAQRALSCILFYGGWQCQFTIVKSTIHVHLSLAHRVVAFRINIGQYLSRNVWIRHNTRSVTFLRCDARKIINRNANVNCAAVTTIKLKYILGKYWFYSRKIDKISINNKNINIFFHNFKI